MYKSWTWSHQNMPRYITMWPRVHVKNSTITTCPVLQRTAKETFVKYIQAIRISRNASPAIFVRFNTEIFTLKYSKCNNYIYYFSKLYDSRQKHKNRQLSYFSFLSQIQKSTNIFDLQFYLSNGNHHTIIIVTDNVCSTHPTLIFDGMNYK